MLTTITRPSAFVVALKAAASEKGHIAALNHLAIALKAENYTADPRWAGAPLLKLIDLIAFEVQKTTEDKRLSEAEAQDYLRDALVFDGQPKAVVHFSDRRATAPAWAAAVRRIEGQLGDSDADAEEMLIATLTETFKAAMPKRQRLTA